MLTVKLTVNNRAYELMIEDNESLLEVLRDRLDLTGAKEGCGYGVCGACTVVVNDQAVTSCTLRGSKMDGARVLTIEGLANNGDLHPIQQAFVQTGAIQCGFCTPGLIMRLYALYHHHPDASEEEIKAALGHHLCRCTGYESIWEAALLSKRLLQQQPSTEQDGCQAT